MKKIEIAEDFFSPSGDQLEGGVRETGRDSGAMEVILGTGLRDKTRASSRVRKKVPVSRHVDSVHPLPASPLTVLLILPLTLARTALRFWSGMIRGVLPGTRR